MNQAVFEQLQQQADTGDAEAQFRLGEMYWTGRYFTDFLVPQDKEKARNLLRSSARQGHDEARTLLATIEPVMIDAEAQQQAANALEASYTRFQWRLVISMCLFGYAGILLLGQVVYWLRFRDWVELPLLYLFVAPPVELYFRERMNPFWPLPNWFVGEWAWLQQPQAWFGLHEIIYKTLSSLHFGVLPIAIGIWVFVTDIFEPSKPSGSTR
jgi:Sel1 repeat-containing protein